MTRLLKCKFYQVGISDFFHLSNHVICTGNFSSNLTNSSTLKREIWSVNDPQYIQRKLSQEEQSIYMVSF